MTIFAERLLKKLEDANMTQAELARVIGASKSTITNWLVSHRQPQVALLIETAKVLNCSMDYLLGLTDKDNTCDTKITHCEECVFYSGYRCYFWRSIDDLRTPHDYCSRAERKK